MKAYIDAYLGEYEKTVGPALMGKRGLRYMITDSYEAPEGYAYDFVNGDALINLLTVQDGHVATPSGMRYRVLVRGRRPGACPWPR